MGLEELLSNPLVLLALGWIAAKWQRDQGAHTKSVQVDTDLIARVRFLEEWQRDHNTIHGCVQSLKATTEAMARNVDRLTKRLDAWMASHPLDLNAPIRRSRSPYEFESAREWIDPDQDEWRT